MSSEKDNFISSMLYYIINNNEWSKQLGYYAYYRDKLKPPSKKLLKSATEQQIKKTISKINNGCEIDEDIFYQKERSKKSENSKTISKTITNINEEENIEYAKLESKYTFTGKNPYKDLVKPENMSDKVYKDMIYRRSCFSKKDFSKFQYSIPENFVLSQI